MLLLRMVKPVDNSKTKTVFPISLVSGVNASSGLESALTSIARQVCRLPERGTPVMQYVCQVCSVKGRSSQGEDQAEG